MNSRQRFLATMRYGNPDRVPLFREGIRSEVIDAWHSEGMSPNADLYDLFYFDRREEIELDVDPRPYPARWPRSHREFVAFQQRLNPQDPNRLPANWSQRVQKWQNRDHILMFRVHQGFFLTMGVEDWQRFYDVMYLLADDLALVREMLAFQGEFAAQLIEIVLQDVEIDAAIFSEPIGGNHGPLISPRMYGSLVLPSYRPVLDVLAKHGVETILFRTYANTRALLPLAIDQGFNCLWAVESPPGTMDYQELRLEFGTELRLIGGIDLDALRFGKVAIHREVVSKVPALLMAGGYLPLADGRVRAEISFENYRYYRRLLERICS